MTETQDLHVLTGPVVSALLENREADILSVVERAYLAHGAGQSSLPHSAFLRFPDDAANRIIALPAYIGADFDAAGVKWIASFPSNIDKGLDRASAAILLNSTETGHVQAVLEGSVISAKRTAAGAALAARELHAPGRVAAAGIIGCGYISFEIVRFLRAVFRDLSHLVVYDVAAERAHRFAWRCRAFGPDIAVDVVDTPAAVFRQTRLIGIATTAGTPHLAGADFRIPGTTVLHISLRDLAPDVILAADNVVDDPDHVCRAQTSLHIVEQRVGNRDFIRCALPDVLARRQPGRLGPDAFVVFSPFGLGILDMAVARLVCELASQGSHGTIVTSFLPQPWHAGERHPAAAAR